MSQFEIRCTNQAEGTRGGMAGVGLVLDMVGVVHADASQVDVAEE